jgi:predicted HTH transcriptional regulator
MTKKEFYQTIIDWSEGKPISCDKEEFVEIAARQLRAIDAQSVKAANRRAAKSLEQNLHWGDELLPLMEENRAYTAKEIADMLGGISTSKVTAIMRALIAEDKITREKDHSVYVYTKA